MNSFSPYLHIYKSYFVAVTTGVAGAVDVVCVSGQGVLDGWAPADLQGCLEQLIKSIPCFFVERCIGACQPIVR